MAGFGISILAIPIVAFGVFLSRGPFMMASNPPSGHWADGPIPMIMTPQFEINKSDIFTSGATHMSLLHNSVFRGYNSIFRQALHVKDIDKADFLGYCLTWHKFVKSHHEDEEENLFPKIEEILNDKTVFVETLKEHGNESFLDGLAEFHTYISGRLKNPTSLSGAELMRIMSSFEAPFATHFKNEIATIAALASHDAAPAVGSAEEALATRAFKVWGKKTVSKAGLVDVLPMFMLNLDRTAENGMWLNWPPMPKPVRWGLVNVVGSWRGPWWKFASCDARGQPRQLHALPDAKK